MPKSYYDKLTYRQLEVVVNRFQNSCYRLKQSGDYPEEKEDKEILNVLVTMKFRQAKEEGIF